MALQGMGITILGLLCTILKRTEVSASWGIENSYAAESSRVMGTGRQVQGTRGG
jgi:hypothetical protein